MARVLRSVVFANRGILHAEECLLIDREQLANMLSAFVVELSELVKIAGLLRIGKEA